MKICGFYNGKTGREEFGVLADEKIYAIGEKAFDSNGVFIRGESFPLDVKTSRLPFTPTKIVCVGRNYAEHAAELGNDVPTEPLLFLKAPSSLIGAGENIRLPEQSKRVEHEGELAFVISRQCQRLSDADDIAPYIFGFLPLNDVTARDLQRKDVQFTRAKSFDTFCPIGNIIETEFDYTDISIETFVNGERRQSGRTSQMIFDIPFLIRYISRQMTLNAGDIIATGTPSGVAPLSDGDVCEVRIQGLDTLSNTVVLES